MDKAAIKEVVQRMTLEEKVSLCSGVGSWYTQDIERLNIPAVMLSDGPVGLRKQDRETDHLGINDSIETVCFPASCATACSFDRELLYQLGRTLGKECQTEDVAILLGPGMNIKRSPLCGRNFEYFSEDPYVTGELAAVYVKGLQSMGTGASVKHFAANSQEHERMNSSSNVDERTLREIYLAAFENVITEARPWTVMCSYNRLNGVYASENPWLLNEVLRKEWNYEGFVMSDWGAVSDRAAGLQAGLDLEMPGNDGTNDAYLIQEVKNGHISEDTLNQSVERILEMVLNYRKDTTLGKDLDEDHAIAAQIERESIVLLKNENRTLPLAPEERVALIGEFARTPRYQGGGSAHVNAHLVTSALDMVKSFERVSFAQGFRIDTDKRDEELETEALEQAKAVDKIVVFAGLPDEYESEGYDRKHLRLPENQNQLITRLASLGKPIAVVLHNGAPVELPWIHEVFAVLEVYLGGEAVGEAVWNILYGTANPCGKLAETFPVRIEDTPCYLHYPGLNQQADYSEGIFVGYRYYDKKKMEVLFPFGHGLSYTSFAYQNLTVSRETITTAEDVTVTVDVTNSGSMAGKEIVQFYVSDLTGVIARPEKELKGFEKVFLRPGETKQVSVVLDGRAFSWYDSEHGRWYAANGNYVIHAGSSSRDIRLSKKIQMTGAGERVPRIDKDLMIGDMKRCVLTSQYLRENEKLNRFIREFTGEREGENGENSEMLDRMVEYMPLRSLRSFSQMKNEDLEEVVGEISALLEKGR